ncbi:MAG: YebC/PmpR family DNA-binding transcriptional regulator, partial [Tidjanibacter sp.]|nr:YebC/PmpR family DNA-binding transcriptional regulator [Tidjanibacter sp.]
SESSDAVVEGPYKITHHKDIRETKIMRFGISDGKVEYAQFLHDYSQIETVSFDSRNGDHADLLLAMRANSLAFKVPAVKPNIITPVIEVILKSIDMGEVSLNLVIPNEEFERISKKCPLILFDTVVNKKNIYNTFVNNEGIDMEELELDLIDLDLSEMFVEEGVINIYAAFEAYGKIQAYLEEHEMEIISGEFIRIPNDQKELTTEQRESINKLIERLEEDDDVVNVYHNMQEEESEE